MKKNNLIKKLIQLICATFITGNLYAVSLHVGSGYPYPNLSQAAAVVQPGDTILVHSGTYSGGLFFSNLQGTSANWIYIFAAPGETVIFSGGSIAWQTTDAIYIHLKGFIFQQQTANGFNMDDGGSYNTPSHHIIIDSCIFRNINATGNNDLLKMSGVDDFEIMNCTFMNGSAGGSGIDMVGCHDGIIMTCRFENLGSNSIQAKGGCSNIRIERNFFKNGGQRTLNLGGSTGLPYFRPLNTTYEAAELKVYANIFIGSDAPIAFVGCINSEVINNTIYLPTKWVMRILQETVDTSRFAPCGHNSFRNNIIYHDNKVSTDCNIGPNTDPQSFLFSNNLWYHSQNASWSGPILPVQDVNKLLGQNPLFADVTSENFDIQSVSPAIASGYSVIQPVQDYEGRDFKTIRSIGAYEGDKASQKSEYLQHSEGLSLYPNPFSTQTTIQINEPLINATITVFSCFGNPVLQVENINGKIFALSRENLACGFYFICLTDENGHISRGQFIISD